MSLLLVTCLLAPIPLPTNTTEDWTRWGGPKRTGVSEESGWSPTGEERWVTGVGVGYSSVVVRGKELYTLGFDKLEKLDRIFRLDSETGDEEWQYSYPAEIMNNAHRGGTLTTPTIDGDMIYVASRQGGLVCLYSDDGELAWSTDQKKEFDLEQPTWGFGASPFINGDQVIMNVGRVIAYDKKTGKVAWKTRENYGHAYSTPMDFEYEGKHCLAVFAGKGLSVIDIKNGDELYRTDWKTRYDVNAATPLIFGTRIFISSGYGKGCAMVELAGGKVKELWSSKVMRNHMSGSVPFGDHLYGFDEAVLKCIDLDGREIWRERGLAKGALTVADGKLIALSGNGELIIADASPEGFKVHSRTEVLDGGICWTPPVLAGGRIYCRNQEGILTCWDHRSSE